MKTDAVNYKSTKLSCYTGFVVQAIVNNFLPILFIVFQDIYGLGYEKLGTLIMFNFVTQMATDLLTPKIVSITGYRKAAVMCQGCAAAGLVMLSVLPRIMNNTYFALVVSILIYAFGSGLMEVILSPMVEMLPSNNKRGNMAFLHSFYCWGQAFTIIVTTALIKLFGYAEWANVPLIWAIIPFVNSMTFYKTPIVEPDADKKDARLRDLLKSRLFVCYMVMMLCAGASEIAMAEWASMFAQQALGISKVLGDLAGPCAFAIFMGIGRIIYGEKANRISFRKTVIITSAMCFVCYMLVAVCRISVISLLACALCGFTVSIFWPGTYSAGSAAFPNGAAVMFSVYAMCGDTGCCLGPWVFGFVAERFGLNAGFAVASVFPLIMFITALVFLKENDCKSV